MDYEGTREGYSIWKGTSTVELMRGEARAWKYVSDGLDFIDSYLVPIQFDQRYPDTKDQDLDDTDSSEMKRWSKGEILDERKEETTDNNTTVRKRRWWCPFKFLPLWGKSIQYKTKEYIMTYEFGDKSKLPTIILIHGYAGSALTYYPLFKYLHGKFHVIGIDLLGMGCSSRPEFLANSTKEAGLFFVESIEQWRKEMKLEKMTLVWHSLGSYIGVKYAHQYPDRVDRMVLLSPLGVEKNLAKYSETFRRADTDAHWIRKYLYAFARYLLKNHQSPIDILRVLGRKPATILIDDYITRRLRLTTEEKEQLFPYFYQMAMSKKSGELAIGRIVELSLAAYEPTHDELIELKNQGIGIIIAFGEHDFLNTKFSGTPIADILSEEGFDVSFIPEATHQVFFDKPKEWVDIIWKLLPYSKKI